jgi:hypothetical protein
MGPRAGLDDVGKRRFLTVLGLKLRALGRPARSQSLYPLRYPGSFRDWGEARKVGISEWVWKTEPGVQVITSELGSYKLVVMFHVYCNENDRVQVKLVFTDPLLINYKNKSGLWVSAETNSLRVCVLSGQVQCGLPNGFVGYISFVRASDFFFLFILTMNDHRGEKVSYLRRWLITDP